jgi:hypothetical protein
MKWKIVVALSVVLFGFAHAQEPAKAKETTTPGESCELTDNDYMVFAALLSGIGGPEDPEEAWSGKQFLLLDKTADIAHVGRRSR